MKKYFIISIITLGLLVFVKPTQAANLPQIIPDCDQTMYRLQLKPGAAMVLESNPKISANSWGTGSYTETNYEIIGYTTSSNCSLNDFLQLFINLFSWGIYIISTLAVFFFFLGGGTLLLSGGSEERIRSGKMILTNTVLGLLVALGSWLIVNVAVIALTGKQSNGIGFVIDNQPWFKTDASSSYEQCTDPPEYPCKSGPGRDTVINAQTYLYDAGCYDKPKPKNQEVDGVLGPTTLEAFHLLETANSKPQTYTLTGVSPDNYPMTCTQFFLNLPKT
jgi:hypothetical protein